MSDKARDTVRAHIRVTGRVQGVGFRAFVQHRGARLGVNGWVRNVGDDALEAVGEGERALIEQFIALMQKGPQSAQVEHTRVEWEQATGEFKAFEVKHSL